MDIENFKVGELDCYRNWDNEGAIYMRNAKTVDLYLKLKNEEFDFEASGLFFAFTDKQFDQGRERLIAKGALTQSDKIYSGDGGVYGKKEGFQAYDRFIDDKIKRVADECDPQEVYFVEYNNYESMISYEGDEMPYKLCVDYFGKERAQKIKRFNRYGE